MVVKILQWEWHQGAVSVEHGHSVIVEQDIFGEGFWGMHFTLAFDTICIKA